MTDILQRIPLEIWINVFQHLDPADQCQCRLVCQSWNHPAEKVIFSSRICLFRENKAIQLYQLLEEKPQLARFIRKITLYFDFDATADTILKLLQASFTSNLENLKIHSFNINTTLYTTLIDAANRSNDTNFRLKNLPTSRDHHNAYDPSYIKAASIFRQSLQELKIALDCQEMDSVLNRLEGFKSLNDLELRIARFQGVEALDPVLNNCHSLRKLHLSFPQRNRDDDDDDDYMAQDESRVLTWAQHHVEQVKTLKRLAVGKPYLDLVLYLIYKYPNMEFFECYGIGFYKERPCVGLLNAAKHLPEFHTYFLYHGHQELQPCISSICALDDMPQNISASFKHSIRAGVSEDYGASMAVETNRGKLDTLHLGISLDYRLSSAVVVDILEHLRLNNNYRIQRLNVNAVLYRPLSILENDDNQLSFYYIVNTFPDLKDLELSIQQIQYQDTALYTQLEKLKIQFAQIDAQVLPQISKQLPRLYLLDISNCSILDEHGQRQNNIHINMPHSSLAVLHVEMKREIFVDVHHYQDMLMRCYSFKTCYLKLSILDVDMTLYCRLERVSIIVQLTPEQFESRPKGDNTIAIIATCGSIARVHVDMSNSMLIPQIDIQEFVLRKLQSQIDILRAEAMNSSSQQDQNAITNQLEDKEEKYRNYLAKAKIFDEKLIDIAEPYSVFSKDDSSIIKDLPE